MPDHPLHFPPSSCWLVSLTTCLQTPDGFSDQLILTALPLHPAFVALLCSVQEHKAPNPLKNQNGKEIDVLFVMQPEFREMSGRMKLI